MINELVKNLKIMFRNWTTISLLVIAPVLLILVIGYTFGSDQFTGLRIGLAGSEGMNISEFSQSVQPYGGIVKYSSIDNCMLDLSIREANICIYVEGLFNQGSKGKGEIPTGRISYYYDNTRKSVSVPLIQLLQEFFGVAEEEISIESAKSIMGDIQNLLNFINSRKDDVSDVKAEAESIKTDLAERKQNLEKARANFLPAYNAVKASQAKLHNYSDEISSRAENISLDIELITDELSSFILISSFIELDDENASSAMERAVNLSYSLKKNLQEFSSIPLSAAAELDNAVFQIDEAVSKMDNIKLILDEEIRRSDEYTAKIDQSIRNMNEVIDELNSKMAELATLDPSVAETLIRPIMTEFSMLVTDAKNIQISFPLLSVIIIMFLSILFSNISALTEIYGRAYMRNLISPVDDLLYIFGMLFTSTLIILFQVAVLFAVAQANFGVEVTGVLGRTLVVSVILIVLFSSIGMIFAYLMKTIQSSILMATFAALALFILSSAMAPFEVMPAISRIISSHSPISVGEYLMTQIQIFDAPFSLISHKILLLIIYVFAAVLVLIVLAKRRNSQR